MSLKNAFSADERTIKTRMDKCANCKYFVASTGSCGTLLIGGTGIHIKTKQPVKLCGCFMRVKTALRIASCPIGKWEPAMRGIKNMPQVIARAKDIIEQVESRGDQWWTREDIREIVSVHASHYASKISPNTTCVECIKNAYDDIKRMVVNYEATQPEAKKYNR